MAEIVPLPSGGTAVIAGEWARNPIVEIIPLPSGGTAIIAGTWARNPIVEIVPLPSGGTAIIAGGLRSWRVGIAWGSPGWAVS